MTKEQGYNGWTNKETWLANLWIDEGYAGGTQAVQERAEDLVRDEIDRLSFDPRGDAASALADEIKELVEGDISERICSTSGLEHDLLAGAISQINWREIAEHYTADVEIPEQVLA